MAIASNDSVLLAAVLEANGWTDIKAGTVSPSGPANEPPLARAVPHHDKDSSIRPASTGPLGDRSLPIAELLTRLVALNHERAAEEQRGLIRWLRPDYQTCGGLRPSHASRAADSSVITSDGHRPPLKRWE